jgi:hypothetical protein
MGEDKFYYTANDQAQRLPNITQSGDSKNDYVGLMSSKQKGKGSMDFKVQNSFMHGGAAFSPSDQRKELMTIDPDLQPVKSRGHQRVASHGVPRPRNNQIQTL